MKHNQIAKPRLISYGHWEIDVLTDDDREITITTTDAELVDKINYDEDWGIEKIEGEL